MRTLTFHLASQTRLSRCGIERVGSCVFSNYGCGGAGNAPLEVFIVAVDRKGLNHDYDAFALMEAAKELVTSLKDRAGADIPLPKLPNLQFVPIFIV